MNEIGNAIGSLIATMFIVLCISVPLGIWKLIEIAIWISHHVSIGVK